MGRKVLLVGVAILVFVLASRLVSQVSGACRQLRADIDAVAAVASEEESQGDADTLLRLLDRLQEAHDQKGC